GRPSPGMVSARTASGGCSSPPTERPTTGQVPPAPRRHLPPKSAFRATSRGAGGWYGPRCRGPGAAMATRYPSLGGHDRRRPGDRLRRTIINVIALGAISGAPVATVSLWLLLTDPA